MNKKLFVLRVTDLTFTRIKITRTLYIIALDETTAIRSVLTHDDVISVEVISTFDFCDVS